MDSLLLIARLFLAAVFLLAAVAKLLDRPGGRRALADFGVSDALAGPLALVLPLLELAVAVALLADASAGEAAIAALALLGVFSIAVAVNLAGGRRPDCNCFGQRRPSPVGGRTLARNGALAAIAGLIAWAGPGDAGQAVAWVGDLRTGEAVSLVMTAVLLVAVALEGSLLLNLFRQNGRLLARVDALDAALGTATAAALEQRAGLPVGAPAPGFALPASSGETVALESLTDDGKPVVLLFTDPQCGPCAELIPEIAGWQREHAGQLTLVVISRKDDHDAGHDGERHLERVLLQQGVEVLDAYKAAGTPSAVVVTPQRTIASRAAFGADSIRALLAEWADRAH